MRRYALAAASLWLFAACASVRRTSEPRTRETAAEQPGATGAAGEGPSAQLDGAAGDISGTWTSSLFEDPLVLQLEVRADGSLSGRVCSVRSTAEGSAPDERNCGSLEAAWTRDGVVHFDFALPWAEVGMAVHYQFVGGGDPLTGVLVIDGRTSPIAFTRVPLAHR